MVCHDLLLSWALGLRWRLCEGSFVSCVPFFDCRSAGFEDQGGLFRYGHIYWNSAGKTVNFVLEVAYKRAVDTAYFKGTAPDSYAQVRIDLVGRAATRFVRVALRLCGAGSSLLVWQTPSMTCLSLWRAGQVGDTVTLFGRETPQFSYGDGSIQRLLLMKVQPNVF